MILVFAAAFLPAADLTFGVSTGINWGWLSGSDWDDLIDMYDADNMVEKGGSFGLFLDIAVSEKISIQPELNLTVTKGGLEAKDIYDDYYDVYFDEELTQSVTMLSLPVLAKYKIGAGKGKFSFLAGPVVSVVMGDVTVTDKITVEGYGSDSEDYDIEPDNSLVLGLTAGAGYEFPVGKGRLYLDFRYYHSLTSIFDDDDTKLNNMGLNLGYGF